MEVPVNEILKSEITKLDYTLIPPGFHGDVRTMRMMQDRLSEIIDSLGEQSAKAQGLRRVITTAKKLRDSPENTLYLLKDAKAKGGEGEAIGLLKVGHKNLYLYDERNQTCEVKPLCVLDFFVLQDRQRRGYGRTLFDYMLQDMGTSAVELAVDGPSPKMEQFLCRSYGIERLVRHSNNFAVTPQFFNNCSNKRPSRDQRRSPADVTNVSDVSRDSGRSTPVSTPAVGRFSAPKPHSTIATVIHGGGSSGHFYQEGENGSASGAATPEPASLEAEPVAEPIPEPAAEPVVEPIAEPSHERPTTLHVEPVDAPAPVPAASPDLPAVSPAGSVLSRRDSQLTDRGYFDVKFYHNKLW